jgi:hypothetical protein
MKNYQLLHAIEKPMNLLYVKPFSNTSDLVNKRPHIHPSQVKAKEEEEKKKADEKIKGKNDEENKTIEME